MLNAFENFIHGDLNFTDRLIKFDYSGFLIGDSLSELVSSYRYTDPVLITVDNDLLVPNFILNKLKVSHSYSCSFFDDFCFDSTGTSDVNVKIFNLGGWYLFPSVNLKDVFPEYYDSRTKQLYIHSILDSFNQSDVYTSNPSFVVNVNGKIFQKLSESKPNVQLSSVDLRESFGLRGDDIIDYIPIDSKIERRQLNDPGYNIVRLSSIDNLDNAISRYYKTCDLLVRQMNYIITQKITNCPMHIFQFGNRYNLNLESYNFDYNYTPISIYNEFLKKNVNEHNSASVLQHNSIVQFLTYDDTMD
jgi:hypothetical protein